MTEAAIIAGSLVDVRNVGTHKSVKLTIHVPEEYATKVVAAFGWPTGGNPVSVAIARMTEFPQRSSPGAVEDRPRPAPTITNAPVGADKPRKSPAQVAGYLCTVQAFQRFLKEKYRKDWNAAMEDDVSDQSEDFGRDAAKHTLYRLCKVDSRSDLTDKNVEWNALRLAYQLWLNEPDLVA